MLIDKYMAPDRHYHNFNHIWNMIQIIDEVELDQLSRDLLVTTTLFHDIVYDPRAKDNEEQSAIYATETLESCHFPAAFIGNVSDLILCTKTHQPSPSLSISEILIDADLSILGAPADEYKSYADAIRKEYAFVGDEDYRMGRTAFLQNFLKRKHIYWTEHFRSQFDTIARKNIANEITSLVPSSFD